MTSEGREGIQRRMETDQATGWARTRLLSIAWAVLLPVSALAGLANLLLEYNFNETGTKALSSGQLNIPVTMRENFGTAQDLHGEPGSGVSGKPEDQAFHNVFVEPTAGYAEQADLPELDSLRSFTLQGWFKTEEPLPIQHAALVDKATPDSGFALWALGSPGTLSLSVLGSLPASPPVYTNTQEWVFFAVTCAIRAKPFQVGEYFVQFYKGTADQPVALVATVQSRGHRWIPENNNGLRIGNSQERDKAFVGYLDNFRVFGSQADGAAVLNAGLLEELRQSDLQNDGRVNVLDLRTIQAGDQVRVTWRKTPRPFALQRRLSLLPDADWQDVTLVPEEDDETLTVTLPPSFGLQFFRLVLP